MREMSVTEQRYKAVLAVIANGRTVGEVAGEWGVCRQTMHRWLARYENDGLEGLGDRSSRPTYCPHQCLREWRRWCSKCVELMLTGERVESPSNWLASTSSPRPQNRRSIAAWCEQPSSTR